EVAQAVLAWRANDGFNVTYPAFRGGTAVGQLRTTPPALASIRAQALGVPSPVVFFRRQQRLPGPPLPLHSAPAVDDFHTVTSPTFWDAFNTARSLGRLTGSTRTEDQTALARFWEGNASVHWNQAANQIARANDLSMSQCNRLLALLNLAMADTAITTWSAKR